MNRMLNEEIVNEIYYKMEDFILNEIDYSKENGYSSRARRYMKRKLNKELEECFNKKFKSDNEVSPFEEDYEFTNYMTIIYLSVVLSGYLYILYIIYNHQSCPSPPL